ncbi:hypothetical protein SAMIE_1017550 [Sphingobium amiense]|uniref:Predicted 3'-5' exonuclease PolB-like domain-containing protein n=1 Tax=Sphingobium amiense TaxID=135719 RepID=A0A494W0Y8_9SPHN|nr:hypothetical protein [Sphingobium amiense]BBD98254.1 hypothetical protein SAMIE_1017550 [Sphingobium amiense]
MRQWQRPPLQYPHEHVTVFDLETIVDEEMPDGSFPPWPRHKPVAGSFLTAHRQGQDHDFTLNTFICREGGEEHFLRKADALFPSGSMAVTLNGRGFDTQVLRLQAQRHGLYDLRNIARIAEAGRYDIDHLDLLDAYGGRGASLAELCNALDIPVKTSVSGADVGDLWRQGDVRAVARYVQEDVLASYLVYLHAIAWRQGDERLIALPLADLSVWIESEPKLQHLKPFATCRPALWARSRAPALRAEAALADAELRRRRERDEAAFAAR